MSKKNKVTVAYIAPNPGSEGVGKYESLFSHGDISNASNLVRTEVEDDVFNIMVHGSLQEHDACCKRILSDNG